MRYLVFASVFLLVMGGINYYIYRRFLRKISAFFKPYLAGLHQHNEATQIFVSRGTGFWGPPLQVLAPSEISRIIIRPA